MAHQRTIIAVFTIEHESDPSMLPTIADLKDDVLRIEPGTLKWFGKPIKESWEYAGPDTEIK